jgi:hypothetical protein
MARSVPDLAMLLSVQAGFDPRAPLSMEGDGSALARRSNAASRESESRGRAISLLSA